jgi:hypothetical protein
VRSRDRKRDSNFMDILTRYLRSSQKDLMLLAFPRTSVTLTRTHIFNQTFSTYTIVGLESHCCILSYTWNTQSVGLP